MLLHSIQKKNCLYRIPFRLKWSLGSRASITWVWRSIVSRGTNWESVPLNFARTMITIGIGAFNISRKPVCLPVKDLESRLVRNPVWSRWWWERLGFFTSENGKSFLFFIFPIYCYEYEVSIVNVVNTSGVHHKKTNCESTAVIAKVQNILKAAQEHLFPTQLTLTVAGTAKKTKLRKGNGGWGDTRDHRLCWNITVYPDLVLPWDQISPPFNFPFQFLLFFSIISFISLPISFCPPTSPPVSSLSQLFQNLVCLAPIPFLSLHRSLFYL